MTFKCDHVTGVMLLVGIPTIFQRPLTVPCPALMVDSLPFVRTVQGKSMYFVDDVFVSHIAFIKQTGSLAIGFSFGCFQLWKLSDLTLE